jgi:hypothetical protein
VHPQPRDLSESALPAARPDALLAESDGTGERDVVAVPAPPVVGRLPFERRQPQTARRSVLPVEWFRRMPGGSTTYAAPGADRPETDPAADGS